MKKPTYKNQKSQINDQVFKSSLFLLDDDFNRKNIISNFKSIASFAKKFNNKTVQKPFNDV